jgi:hypothetical protein
MNKWTSQKYDCTLCISGHYGKSYIEEIEISFNSSDDSDNKFL